MKKKLSKRAKIALLVLASALALLLLVVVAGVIYINSKMSMLSRPTSGSYSIAESIPEDEELSFEHLDLDYIDVMENGGNIAPPEGDVNVHEDITNILLIGSDEREENKSDTGRADSMMLLSINSKDNTWKLASFERGLSLIHI